MAYLVIGQAPTKFELIYKKSAQTQKSSFNNKNHAEIAIFTSAVFLPKDLF